MIVLLRPEPGAGATLARAKACGLEAVAVPLFTIEPVAWDAPDPSTFDALLLTSANSVRAAGEPLLKLRGLAAYTVGDATAAAARDAGFDIAGSGELGVDRLLGSIESDLRLLHPCGEDRRPPDSAKQAITPLVVYRAVTVDAPDLSMASGSVVLVHSPRAGRRLAELVADDARSNVVIAAISPAAAAAVGEGWSRVQSADRPEDAALLALAGRLWQKSAGE